MPAVAGFWRAVQVALVVIIEVLVAGVAASGVGTDNSQFDGGRWCRVPVVRVRCQWCCRYGGAGSSTNSGCFGCWWCGWSWWYGRFRAGWVSMMQGPLVVQVAKALPVVQAVPGGHSGTSVTEGQWYRW